jgi:hypothetical protein
MATTLAPSTQSRFAFHKITLTYRTIQKEFKKMEELNDFVE